MRSLMRAFMLVLLAAAGCATPPLYSQVATTIPPIPPLAARIYIYRGPDVYQDLSWVPVFFNGERAGAVGPGQVILRDVVAGTYDIAPGGQGLYPNQNKVVALAPGQTVYAKITSFLSIGPSTPRQGLEATFVVTIMDPYIAQREILGLSYMAESGAQPGG